MADDILSSFTKSLGISPQKLPGIIPSSSSQSIQEDDPNYINSLVSAINTASRQSYDKSIMMRGLDLARISPVDWNKVFPYRFIILQTQPDGNYKKYGNLSVTLPITPQDLQIATQFASTVSVASRGIHEEDNGVNIKQISFTATTGIHVIRDSFTVEKKSEGALQTIFGGTLQAVQDFRSAVATVLPRKQNSIEDRVSENITTARMNGYFQYHVIRAFLELYAELKKRPSGRGYRLGLDLGKDKVIYLVTPQSFVTRKSATSPMEYTYTFSGTAWGTVSDKSLLSKEKSAERYLGNTLSDMQKTLNGIRNARRIFETARDIITAVKTDVETNIFGPISNILLTLKEVTSIPPTIADFPKELRTAWQSTVVKEAESLAAAMGDNLKTKFRAAVSPSLAESSTGDTPGGTVSTDSSVLDDISITDAIDVNAISVTPEQQEAMSNAIEQAANTSNSDLLNLIDNLDAMSLALEDQAVTQGVDSPVWEILYAAAETKTHIYSLLSDNFFGTSDVSEQNSGASALMDFYQGYAATGDVNFTRPKGKFAIPFPFRTSLEWLAQRYLGDATRWIEIVAANNLQPPYIDEDGFTRAFLTNGQGRQFNIESSDNLYIDQSVWVFSDTKSLQRRKIKSIQKVTDTNFIITVDGEDNLNEWLLGENAKMRAYLPNTVNSQKLIYIPIDTPSSITATQTTSITFLDETPEMLSMAKIDWLLDHNGDLAVSADGFQNLAYGKNNIIQAAKLKMKTVAGELLLHPGFGAGVEVGTSEADFSIDDLVSKIKDSFLEDPRFESVDRIEITQESGVLRVHITVTAADNQGIVPISYDLSQ